MEDECNENILSLQTDIVELLKNKYKLEAHQVFGILNECKIMEFIKENYGVLEECGDKYLVKFIEDTLKIRGYTFLKEHNKGL